MTYSVTAHLDLPFSKETVTSILKRAEAIGCYFFLPDWDVMDPKRYKKLTLEQAAETLFYGLSNYNFNIITLQYHTTFIDVLSNGDANQTSVTFSDFWYPWYVIVEGNEELDMVRYTNLMLELIEGFPLVDLHVEKS